LTIRIGNKHRLIDISQEYQDEYKGQALLTVYCGRGSPLGNPFVITASADRNTVCDQYAHWFQLRVETPEAHQFHDYLRSIIDAAKLGDVHLLCWCAPARCHCETIKGHVEKILGQDESK
jgi:hypothetical protein